MNKLITAVSSGLALVGAIAAGVIYAESSYNQTKDVQDIYTLMKSKEVASHKQVIRQIKKEIRVIKIKDVPTMAEKSALLELKDELQLMNSELAHALK